MPETTPSNLPEIEPIIPVDVPDTQVDQEDKEWQEAVQESFPQVKQENSQDASEKKPAEPVAPTPLETPQQTAANPQPEKVETAPVSPVATDISSIEARMSQREFAQEVQSLKDEVRAKMFPDTFELKDADGDPIRGADDLLRHINPNTGENFTSEEATLAWLQYEREVDARRSANEAVVEQVAMVNASLKDEADIVKSKYGEFLNKNPQLQQQIWDLFSKTLEVDPKTGVIVRAPTPLSQFYAVTLQPYLDAQKSQDEAAQQQAEAQKQAEEARVKQAELEKKQARIDRSDIYAAGKVDTMDAEEKEWSEAAKSYYGS